MTTPTMRDIWLTYHRGQVQRYERRLKREWDEAVRLLCQEQLRKHRVAIAGLEREKLSGAKQ